MREIVVVGAGLAGLRAVEQLRRAGFDGDLTLVGDESYAPYNRPPLSKQVLGGAQDPAECLIPRDVDVVLRLGSRAVGLDRSARRVLLADGTALGYDGLVITTGCRARTWPGRPAMPGSYTLRSIDDAVAFREAALAAGRVAVVGAGLVGCEAAATLRRLGVDITLIDHAPRPMMPLGPELGARAAALHAAHGVELRLSTAVVGLAGEQAVTGVRLADGSTVAADVVLLALGGIPNVDWLAGSGLDATERTGVRCNEYCAVIDDPRIVAAGDVAEFGLTGGERVRLEHWSNAAEMAGIAASNLIAPPHERMPYAPVPTMWTDQYDVRFQSVGFLGDATHWQTVEDDPESGRLVIEGILHGDVIAAVGINAVRRMLRYQLRLSTARAMV